MSRARVFSEALRRQTGCVCVCMCERKRKRVGERQWKRARERESDTHPSRLPSNYSTFPCFANGRTILSLSIPLTLTRSLFSLFGVLSILLCAPCVCNESVSRPAIKESPGNLAWPLAYTNCFASPRLLRMTDRAKQFFRVIVRKTLVLTACAARLFSRTYARSRSFPLFPRLHRWGAKNARRFEF